MSKFRRIAVLMGGTSNEREVSLVSGRNVADALESLNLYDVARVTLDSDDLSALPADVDACYVALHGGWGENGGVQAALDKLGIPYTGPGAAACRATMDKIATKRILDAAGVPTAPWFVEKRSSVRVLECSSENTQIPNAESNSNALPLQHSPTSPLEHSNTLTLDHFPVVVKAPRDGSSVGVYLVKKAEDYARAAEDARRIDREKFGGDGEALVEDFIPGREMTVGVLGDQTLPVVEICAPGGWYGYDEKYNSDETRYPFPRDSFLPEMQRVAKLAFDATGCRGVARVDFRITPEGKMYVLELNTSPGMTGHSLVPKAAAEAGIPFPELCRRVLESAAHD